MGTSKDFGSRIQTFVLFDTETTGLQSPGNNPRITELCFLALVRDELEMENGPVRAINKLCLCFNPRKRISRESTIITGLHNDSLEKLSTFKTQSALVCEFLQNLPQPVCLVAHNGNRFDFPLLVAHFKTSMQKIPESILCADSLEAFRIFDGLSAVPEFAQKEAKNTRESLVTTPKPSDPGCIINNQNKLNGSFVEDNGDNQNPNRCEVLSSPALKREPECEKDTSRDVLTGDTGLAQWETEGLVTPAKKARTMKAATPTKKVFSSQDSDEATISLGIGVRQNLLKTLSDVDAENESQQTIPYSLTEMTNSPETLDKQEECNKYKEPESLSQSHQQGEALPQEEKNDDEEDLLQHQSLSSFPSMSDDSEKFLLEAVEKAEEEYAADKQSNCQTNGESKTTSPSRNAKPESNGSISHFAASGYADGCRNNSSGKAPKVSYSLPKLYERTFGQQPLVSHTAEDDCQTLLQVIRNKAIDKFPQWCDKNAVPLSSVPPMY